MTGIETPAGGFLDYEGCVCDHAGLLHACGNQAGEIYCRHCLAVWRPVGGNYLLTRESWHLLLVRRRRKALLEKKPSFGESLIAVVALLLIPFRGPDDCW